MEEELYLFYKIWGKNIPVPTPYISIKKLQIWTQHDIKIFSSIKYCIIFLTIVIFSIIITSFVALIPLAILSFYYRLNAPKCSRKDFAKIKIIHTGIQAFNNKDYTKALEIFENIRDLIRTNDKEFNSWLLECYVQQKEYNKALSLINENPNIKGKRIKTLQIYFDIGRLQEINKIINNSYPQIELIHRPVILAILGSILLKQGYPDIAKERISVYTPEKHQLSEDNFAYLYTLGKCEEALGNIQEAQKAYRTIQAFNPNFMDVNELVKN